MHSSETSGTRLPVTFSGAGGPVLHAGVAPQRAGGGQLPVPFPPSSEAGLGQGEQIAGSNSGAQKSLETANVLNGIVSRPAYFVTSGWTPRFTKKGPGRKTRFEALLRRYADAPEGPETHGLAVGTATAASWGPRRCSRQEVGSQLLHHCEGRGLGLATSQHRWLVRTLLPPMGVCPPPGRCHV